MYSWTVDFSVRCADTNRPLRPLSEDVSVGTVEIAEYRDPNTPLLTTRQCPS